MSGIITNYSVNETRRLDFLIGVSYDDNPQQATATLEAVAAAHPLVLEEPAPFVGVSDLGESSVNLVVRVWVKRTDFRAARFGLADQFKLALEQEGMSIPYPQRDLHLRNGQAIADTPIAQE
jgi:small conductance mechanosensitive channel